MDLVAESPTAGIIETQVGSNFVQALHGKGGQEEVVADRIDQPGDTLGSKMDLINQFRGQNGLVAETGAGHPGIHVGLGLLRLKSPQNAPQSDPLLELAELRGFQFRVKFLLACQDDLEELALAVLQIS